MGDRGAWQPAPYKNQYEGEKSCATAVGRTIARHVPVKSPGFSKYSQSGLARVAREKSSAENQEGNAWHHQPAFIELTSSIEKCVFG